MDWKQAIREERAMLKSIAALLLMLADLAERAARHSRAAACLMLFILRPVASAAAIPHPEGPKDGQDKRLAPEGEAEPRRTLGDGLPELPFAVSTDPRAELIHLALRFRLLAHLMECEAELGVLETRRRSGVTPHEIGAILSRAMAAFGLTRSVEPPDTS